MSTIKIFLASSNELKDIRDELNSQIVKKNKIWKDTGIELDLYRWEEETARVFKYGLQEEYNMNIRDADVFVLLAKTKMGKYTHEEFDVAFREYSAANKPFLFTYFQKTETEPEDSLKEFMGKLNSLKHYLTTFNDFNHLWTQFNDELDRLRAAQFRENKFDTGKLDISYFVNIIQNFNQNITQNFHIYGEKKIPKDLTSSPVPSQVFVGRDEQLRELHKFVEHNEENQTGVVIIRGIGGVGKTTFARYFYNEYMNEYRHIAWIDFHGNLRDSFSANKDLINSLQIKDEEIKGKTSEDIFSMIITEMKIIGCEGKCMLIVDNADSSYDEEEFERIFMSGWNIILTSRVKLSENIKEFNLNVLNDDEAFRMFRELCPDKNKISDEQIKTLLEGVGNHTLMIEILAKHSNRFTTDFDKLNNCFPENLKTKITLARDNKKIEGDITKFLKEIFRITDLKEKEKKVLINFTAMPSVPVDYEKLVILLKGEDDELEFTLVDLEEKGWLQKEGNGYKMHRLIQQVLRKEFSPSEEDLAKLITNVTVLLRIDHSKDNPSDKFQWTPFGDSIVKVITNRDKTLNTLLQNNLALVYEDLGEYEKARDLLEKALESDIRNFGEKHPNVSRSQSNLAYIYSDLGEYEKARDLQEKALESDISNFGDEHPNVTRCQSNLAKVYCALGEFEKARHLLEKALESDKRNFGDMHPNVARSQSNLALVYQALGEYEKARDLLEFALESDIKNFGDKHPNVTRCQSNLANVFSALGKHEKARALLVLALESAIKNFGKIHPNVATCQSNLANVYSALGEYEKARDLLELAQESTIKNFGKVHTNVTICQSNLANVYSDLGEYEKARDLLELALESDIKNFGNKHPIVAVRQSNLGNVYSELGEYEKARVLLEIALDSDIKNFGNKHPNIAVRQSNLANIYSKLGEYKKARDMLEKALDSDIKNFGEKHPNVARNQSNLANAYGYLGEYEKARDLLEKALSSDIKNFGNNHPNVARIQSNLANINSNLGENEKACYLFENALESYIKNFGDKHPNVALCQSNLAAVYVNIDKVPEAVKLWESSYSIFKNQFGENHPNTRTVKEWIELYKDKSI